MKLITKYIILTLILTGAYGTALCQELDEIIQLHLKAHGDLTKWDEVESMKITGLFTAFSEEDDFMAIKTKDGSYYSELALGKADVIEGFNGTSGWTIDPWFEILYPRELNRDERNVFKQKAEFFTPFYNYKEKGIEIELIGKTNIDGIEVFEIKLTRPSRYKETWFLRADNYLEYKYTSRWVDFTYGVPSETYFDDFRDFDGMIIPCFVERTFSQRDRMLIIEDIEFNVEVDPNIFVMPRSKEIEDIDFMVGEWNVAVKAFYSRGNLWYKVDSTESIIQFESTNLISEKISFSNSFVQSTINNFTFNSNNNNYRISSYDGITSNINLFDGYKTDTTFIIENAQIGCDSTFSLNSRISYGNITVDTFEAEISQSNDNGETWNSSLKLKYYRKKEE